MSSNRGSHVPASGSTRFGAPSGRLFAIAVILLVNAAASDGAHAEELGLLRSEVEGYLLTLSESAADQAGEARRLLREASELETAGELEAAEKRLREARKIAIRAVTSTRDQETVVYGKEFRTPRDEYRHERERYRTYVELFRKVMERGRVSGSMQERLERAHDQSGATLERAEALASRGQWKDASELAAEASRELGSRLRRLGLPVSH